MMNLLSKLKLSPQQREMVAQKAPLWLIIEREEFQDLIKHPGWNYYQQMLLNRRALLVRQLMSLEVKGFFGWVSFLWKLLELRAEVRVIEKYLTVRESDIDEGKRIRELTSKMNLGDALNEN